MCHNPDKPNWLKWGVRVKVKDTDGQFLYGTYRGNSYRGVTCNFLQGIVEMSDKSIAAVHIRDIKKA